MSKTQVFTPAGGMNQDDSIITPTPDTAGRNAFGLGDYKYALNARIGSSKSDNFGDLETLKGTTEVTSYFVRSGGSWISGSRPTGTEKVVGRYSNREFQKIYYAVYNSEGNHCIRFYDSVTNGIYELLKWSGLSFTSTMFVSMAMVESWMALTDRTNSPRLINVDTISDFFNDLTLSNFREYHISFHKWAPVMPPIVRVHWNGVNNFYERYENKTYQFSYRYIYKGRLRSRWSPISNSAEQFSGESGSQISAIELYIPGFTLNLPGDLVEYNYFGNEDAKFYKAVETIEVAFRDSARGLWRLFQRYNFRTFDNVLYRYDGSSDGTPIPLEDFTQLFDTVPRIAGIVESVDNRFVFSDCLDEYDPSVIPVVTDIGVATWGGDDNLSTWWNGGSNNQSDNAILFPGMSATDAQELGLRNLLCDTTFKGRGLYKVGIQFLAANGWRSAIYTSETWIYDIPAETGIVDKLYALMFKFDPTYSPPEWAVAYQIVRTNCLNIDYFMFGAVNTFTPLIDSTTVLSDNLEVPESLRNRIQQHFENAKLVTGQDYGKYLETLANTPFFQSVASDVRRTAITAIISDASRIYIDVNNWYNSSRKNAGGTQNNPMNNLYYNYRQGDRVRFLASTSATPSESDKTVYDVPILEFTGRGIVIEKPAGIQWLPGGTGSLNLNYMIEVYTPKVPQQSDYVYYESGEWYPILYPGTAQRDFAKRDWTYTNNAAITCNTYGDIKVFNNRPFSYGDAHGVLRSYFYNLRAGSTSTALYTASMNPDRNKTFDFWEKNDGRPSVSYSELPVASFKTTQMRFGGQVVEQSFINQINRFREDDQKIFPSEYGRIRMVVNTGNAQVESVGSILLVIGERETFSIYVNRTTLEDLSGNTQVTLSNKILGSYNTLLGSHGTLNPESVCVERGRVYFWDAIDGTWVRYGRDGLTEISFYKMRNWFRELGALLINQYGATPPQIISEFDPYNEELVIYMNHSSLPGTFRDYTTYKGAMFSEEDVRWKSIHSYTPEMFGKINNQLLSFRAGSLYIHEQSSTYSTFYGTKHDVYIEPVFNEMPKDVKSWQNMAYVATHKWCVERFLSEYRGAKTKQQSSMTLAQFDEREDAYYGDIPMNINTPVVANPIINGDKMRSKAIRALMKLDPSVVILSLLHYVEAGEINSPKNP